MKTKNAFFFSFKNAIELSLGSKNVLIYKTQMSSKVSFKDFSDFTIHPIKCPLNYPFTKIICNYFDMLCFTTVSLRT